MSNFFNRDTVLPVMRLIQDESRLYRWKNKECGRKTSMLQLRLHPEMTNNDDDDDMIGRVSK